MERLLSIFFTVCILLSSTVNNRGDSETYPTGTAIPQTIVRSPRFRLIPDELVHSHKKNAATFSGKIGIIASSGFFSNLSFRIAGDTNEKHDCDKISFAEWPASLIGDAKEQLEILVEDRDIDTIIVNPAIAGTHTYIAELQEKRDDVFYICMEPMDDFGVLAKKVDLVLVIDELSMGTAMVKQAIKMGANVFVHYSYPRRINQPIYSKRLDIIKEECKKTGLTLLDLSSIDPAKESGVSAAREFIRESVPRIVEEYGENTAFFSVCFSDPNILAETVIGSRAIFVQTSRVSPYHAFSEAFGVKHQIDEWLIPYDILNREIKKAVAQENMTGRISYG